MNVDFDKYMTDRIITINQKWNKRIHNINKGKYFNVICPTVVKSWVGHKSFINN